MHKGPRGRLEPRQVQVHQHAGADVGHEAGPQVVCLRRGRLVRLLAQPDALAAHARRARRRRLRRQRGPGQRLPLCPRRQRIRHLGPAGQEGRRVHPRPGHKVRRRRARHMLRRCAHGQGAGRGWRHRQACASHVQRRADQHPALWRGPLVRAHPDAAPHGRRAGRPGLAV